MSKEYDKEYRVDGFLFTDEEEAEAARKETEGVKYIREKTDMNRPEMVLQIYNKMIEGNLFETIVGYTYLKELQEYLGTIPSIKGEDVRPIPVIPPHVQKDISENTDKKEQNDSGQKTGRKLKCSLFLNLILAVCVIAMFAISISSSSPTILDYETKLVDRYEAWEQELSEREKAVQQRERALENPADR